MSKIAIVGCQQSGKTVFMASLSDYFRAGQRENQSSWLIPENSDAHKFTEMRNYEMRVKHEWPDATWNAPTSLKWSLHLKNGETSDVEMLEFGGEVFRAAFKEDGADPQNREAAEKLVSYLIDAKFVVVLVAMKELFRKEDEHDRYVDEDIESTWVTRGLIDFVKKNLPKDVGLLVALTQADLYKKELDEMGGPVGVLKKKWPMIYALYPNLPVVSVASVSKTTADGRPAEGYTTEGVLPVMKAFSEYMYGSPTGVIAELDDIVTAICSTEKPFAMDVLEQKLEKHGRLIEELRNKVTIVDALYDDVITRHTEFNQAAIGLLKCLKSLLNCKVEDQQSDKTWNELRERFPMLMPAIGIYQRESREQYADLLARREREAEEERKRREAEELRLAEEAKKDEERKRQLELAERERMAEAERVKIEKEEATVKSRSFVIRVMGIIAVVCGVVWGVSEYYGKKQNAEIERRNRIESENAVKLAEVRKAEALQREQEEKNKAVELARQKLEEENRRKELELKKMEESKSLELEKRRVAELDAAKKQKENEKAQAAMKLEQQKAELELKRVECERAAAELKVRQTEAENEKERLRQAGEKMAKEEAKKNANARFGELEVAFDRALRYKDLDEAEACANQMNDLFDNLTDENVSRCAQVCFDLGVLYMNTTSAKRSYKMAKEYFLAAERLGKDDQKTKLMIERCEEHLGDLQIRERRNKLLNMH